MPRNVSPWRPIALLFLAFLLLLGVGAVRTRHNYLTRGIPEGLPLPVAHGGARIGLNVALQQYDQAQLEDSLQRIAATGVRYVKQPFYYPGDDPYDWPASEQIITATRHQDLEMAVLLDGNPDRNFAPPDDPEDFAAWAGEFARRFGEHVQYYFIWDEPNLSSHWGQQPVNAAEYAAILSATARTIRTADGDAVVVAAPLAPTSETGPNNLADTRYLQELYAAGAGDFFDAVAGKPYGFYSGPDDRTVDVNALNFSRAILLREVMLEYGDGHKALFAGNWGWNALPPNWAGPPSIWGETDPQTRVAYTAQALARARTEWPWMGLMFLETWEAPAPADDPRHGFDVTGTPLEAALSDMVAGSDLAYPGFHLADAQGPGQQYEGAWRFSPLYGADISQTGDSVTLRFWGTSAGLRIRRADYRARLYVTIDGQPAPGLPHDGEGAALVLTTPDIDPQSEYLDTVLVADNLGPGPHVMTVEAYRGWDQWALNGFSVGYRPDSTTSTAATVALLLGALIFAVLGALAARRVPWQLAANAWLRRYRGLSERAKLLGTVFAAGLVALTGWLTWGEQAAGVYRRLGDLGQLALTAAAASLFYIAPVFIIYLLALVLLLFFIYARPAWGLALVAFTFPFYVQPKPMGGYAFSPVEIFVVVTAAATALSYAERLRHLLAATLQEKPDARLSLLQGWQALREQLRAADYAVAFFVLVATASLFFTERLDVATNEWRMVIIEPALFYALFRLIRPRPTQMWRILDAFVLGGVVVAVYGLWQYALGQNVVTVAGGLARLSSIYGSPNNVALYLGRVLPFLFAGALIGLALPLRRLLYGLAMVPVGIALLLTFSKGGLFLGVPAGIGVVILLWLRGTKRPIWPWLVGGVLLTAGAAAVIFSVPALAQRLDLQGTTSVLRLSLWKASLNMFVENPLFGVGLDNFLYAYRGRYILDSGWEEPYLNHPHNIILDFATRLGVAGLLAGVWLFASLLRNLWRLPGRLSGEWRPVAVGVAGMVTQMLAHGLVDHSFFLVDLSFVFFLLLGLTVWLQTNRETFARVSG